MSRAMKIRAAAEQEFNDAAGWYYLEDVLVGDRFVSEIEDALAKINRKPMSYPVVFGSAIRRAVVNRFPFSIFFIVDDQFVSILSIFHDSRNPIIWQGRE